MAIIKPTIFPVWADQNRTDPISGQNNVTTPPLEKQNYGWTFDEQPPRNWFNWLGRYTNNWLQYLAQMINQEVTTTDASGGTALYDVTNGGMCLIYIIDTGAFSTWYEGITYIPPGYSSGTTTFRQVAANGSTLTISAISASGTITVSGGTGNYVIYGKTKTPGL